MVLTLLVCLMLLTLLQRKLIYQPLRERVLPSMAETFSDRLSDVSLVTADGLTLEGWRVAARPPEDGPHSPRRLLTIYFQGNAAHRGRRGKQITMLSDLGSEVLIVDYRGYGGNAGSPSESGLGEDARSAWRYATERLGFRPEEIILFGESLGGGVATALCAELADAGTVPGGLILRASFTSLVDAALTHYPFLPVSWLLVDRFPSEERLPRIACPILVMHGDRDRIIPLEQGERLFAAAPARSANGVEKRFVRLDGAGHNDILHVAFREVESSLAELFSTLP
jgi:fermentation-respiration switch protein FrsA (DUF1100 family)